MVIFFKRPFKRIQIHIFEINEVRTFIEKVNVQNALDTLRKFKDIVDGKKPKPPKDWKCKRCEFNPFNPNSVFSRNLCRFKA